MKDRQNRVVVDTSLAIKWIVYEADSPLAQTLLIGWATKNYFLMAPDLLIYEITNSLYKKVRKEEITYEAPIHALNTLMETSLYFEAIADEKLSLRALDFARAFKLPATYDAHYLALAEREQCEFWTADERLYNAVREQLAWVRLMADDPSVSTPA